jgi:hypothetical protein
MVMGNRAEQPSNFNSTLWAVYGCSFGLVALAGRNSRFRVLSALAGAGLLLCSALGLKAAQRVTARPRSGHMDRALEESFPASDPPTWSSPDLPPSNAEAKWKAHREAMGEAEGEGEQPRPDER